MRQAMRQVTGVVVHPQTYEQLLKSVHGGPRVMPMEEITSGNMIFLSPDGKPLGKIENIEQQPPTVFLQEVEKIK